MNRVSANINGAGGANAGAGSLGKPAESGKGGRDQWHAYDQTLPHAHAIYVFALERPDEPLGASNRSNPLLRWAAAGGTRL